MERCSKGLSTVGKTADFDYCLIALNYQKLLYI